MAMRDDVGVSEATIEAEVDEGGVMVVESIDDEKIRNRTNGPNRSTVDHDGPHQIAPFFSATLHSRHTSPRYLSVLYIYTQNIRKCL